MHIDPMYELLVRALIALGVSTLIGLEREHHSTESFVLAGARTYPLVGLIGFICGFLSYGPSSLFPYMVYIGLAGVLCMAILTVLIRYSKGHYGTTSSISFVITYVIGVLIGVGEGIVNIYSVTAVFAGVVVTFMLVKKTRIHRLAYKLRTTEIISAAEFLLVLLVLLPIALSLEGAIDPYGLIGPGLMFDPTFILTIVVIVSVLSFGSFLIVRRYGGTRGLMFTGLFGGFVNSVVATTTLANLAKEDKKLVWPAAVGIYISTISLLIRNMVLCIIAAPDYDLIMKLSIPFAIVILAVSVIVLFESGKLGKHQGKDVNLESPFAVWPAVKFALIFAGIIALTSVLTDQFREFGFLSVSLGGIVSSSAVAASASHRYFTDPTISSDMTAVVVITATTLATINKIAITYSSSRLVFHKVKWKLVLITLIITATIPLVYLL